MVEPIAGVQDDDTGVVVDLGGVLDEVVGPVDAGEDEPEGDVGLGCFLQLSSGIVCDRGRTFGRCPGWRVHVLEGSGWGGRGVGHGTWVMRSMVPGAGGAVMRRRLRCGGLLVVVALLKAVLFSGGLAVSSAVPGYPLR